VSAHEILASTPGLAGRLSTGAQLQSSGPARHVLPVDGAWAAILPGGSLQRGRVYVCRGTGARSMALSLVARAVTVGSWLAMVDVDDLGYGAMSDHGVALERVVSVVHDGGGDVARTIGALCDGFDLIIAGRLPGGSGEARRLVSRVQVQQSVLIVLDEHGADRSHGADRNSHSHGAFPSDVVLTGESISWTFDSHARRRSVTVRCGGRRAAGESVHLVRLPSDDD